MEGYGLCSEFQVCTLVCQTLHMNPGLHIRAPVTSCYIHSPKTISETPTSHHHACQDTDSLPGDDDQPDAACPAEAQCNDGQGWVLLREGLYDAV